MYASYMPFGICEKWKYSQRSEGNSIFQSPKNGFTLAIEYLSFSTTTRTEYFASANDRIKWSLREIGKMQFPLRGVVKNIVHCQVSKFECNISTNQLFLAKVRKVLYVQNM
jgi:hypothetical protein